MTATLTFNLPEEAEDHQTAIDGWKWKQVIREMDELLRSKVKYGNDFVFPNETLTFARQAIHDLMTEYNLSLD